jgi:hypothetical protein
MTVSVSQLTKTLRAVRRYPFAHFVPNGKQAEFIHTRATSGKKIVGLSTGNGVGKSTVLINMIANIIMPGMNRHFDYEFFKHPHGPRRIRIISHPKHIADDGRIQNLIDEWFPREWLEGGRKDKQGYRHLLPNCNGWEVQILSNQLETNAYAGNEVSVIGFDEPFRKAIFGENKARTRSGGHISITLTPITEPGAEASEVAWLWEEMIENDDHDAVFLFGGFEENCKTHGRPGFLEHGELVAAIDGCDEEEYAARAHGIFKNIGGAVYPSWKNNEKTILRSPSDLRQWSKPGVDSPTIYMMLDPHDSKPFAMLWFALFADGHGEFFAEYPERSDYHKQQRAKETLEDYVRIIRRIEARFWPLKPRVRIIDGNYGNQERLVGSARTTIKRDLARLSKGQMRFINNPGGNQPWKNAKHILHQKFTPSKVTNLPIWQCWHTLKNLDYAMRHYMMLTRSGRTADIQGAASGPEVVSAGGAGLG